MTTSSSSAAATSRLALFTALASCASAPQPPPGTPARGGAAPETSAAAMERAGTGLLPPPLVRLLESGAAPHVALRYQFTAGQAESLLMELSSAMTLAVGEMTPPEMRTPAVRLTIDLRARGVDDTGQATLEGTISRVEVAPAPDVSSAVVAAVGSDLEPLAGTSFAAVLTPRGHLARLALSLPRESNPQLATTLEWVRNGLRMLLPVLPEEPVGKGARWEARSRASVGPAQADETSIYTMTTAAVQAQLRLAVKLALASGQQTVALAGMPPGATLNLRSLSGAGGGTAEVSMTTLVPTTELRWTSTATGSAQPAGEPVAPVKITTASTLVIRKAR